MGHTEYQFTRQDFPNDFLFGTATSAYQIEGSGFGGAGRCHWDDFSATPGNVVGAANGKRACDHYHHWADDLDLVANGGFDAYRFSLSWARILPDGRGKVNEQGLDFYERIVDGMLERNLKPFATLYHWELPSALADLGGWRNREIADWFADYAEIVARRLGDRLATTATFNEPWCISWLSHFLGIHAPGIRDIRAAARAMHHILVAHGKAMERMREVGLSNLGIVLNFEYAEPANDSEEAVRATQRYDGIYNRWFLGGLMHKRYPGDILAELEQHLPQGYQDDLDSLITPVDWLGVNYYTRAVIAHDANTPFPSLKTVSGPLPKTTMGWEIFPEGFSRLLTRIWQDYSGDVPLYVTENGLSLDDHVENGQVSDPIRVAYVNDHLAELQRVMEAGAPIKGYFLWSLLDNYEWALGYDKRFGLVHVDFDSLKRTPKDSYLALARVLGGKQAG